MDNLDYNKVFAIKTKQIAISIIKEFSKLPYNEAFSVIRKQIYRSSTSMAANYRAMCRARSKAERFSNYPSLLKKPTKLYFGLKCLKN